MMMFELSGKPVKQQDSRLYDIINKGGCFFLANLMVHQMYIGCFYAASTINVMYDEMVKVKAMKVDCLVNDIQLFQNHLFSLWGHFGHQPRKVWYEKSNVFIPVEPFDGGMLRIYKRIRKDSIQHWELTFFNPSRNEYADYCMEGIMYYDLHPKYQNRISSNIRCKSPLFNYFGLI